jgi:integrase
MKFTKVTVRKKKLSKGRVSLYLDFYPPISHPQTGEPTRREFLHLYFIDRPRSEQETTEKANTLMQANAIRLARELQIKNGEAGISSTKGKESFVSYFVAFAARQTGSTAKGYSNCLKHLRLFLGKDISFDGVTPDFIDNFRYYLKTSAKIQTDGRSGGLSAGTSSSYFTKFMAVVRKAKANGYISHTIPVFSRDRPPDSLREFLTLEELQSLTDTPCEQPYLKRAALFSALTGLRFSDIEKMKWGEVQSGPDGYSIKFRIQKTQDMISLPIGENAFSVLGKPGQPDEKIFKGFVYSNSLNLKLRIWIAAAGIKKHITFHSLRHTYAMLQLSAGTDIYTLSNMLGHKDIATTQIYAKVQEKAKRETVNKIDIKF